MAAARAAKVLLGCFRTGEANDPDVYTTAVMATLARYPEHIIREVSDPRTGLPARSKFLPTVSEVREACEAIAAAEARRAEREAREKETLEARRKAEIERAARPTLAEIHEKYGERYGLSAPPEPEAEKPGGGHDRG